MWRKSTCRLRRRPHSSAGARLRRVIEDEGDSGFENEWLGAQGYDNDDTNNNDNVIFYQHSDKGNGVVSVVSLLDAEGELLAEDGEMAAVEVQAGPWKQRAVPGHEIFMEIAKIQWRHSSEYGQSHDCPYPVSASRS